MGGPKRAPLFLLLIVLGGIVFFLMKNQTEHRTALIPTNFPAYADFMIKGIAITLTLYVLVWLLSRDKNLGYDHQWYWLFFISGKALLNLLMLYGVSQWNYTSISGWVLYGISIMLGKMLVNFITFGKFIDPNWWGWGAGNPIMNNTVFFYFMTPALLLIETAFMLPDIRVNKLLGFKNIKRENLK